jgi:XTP/dITP diphosphohydrolase
VTGTLLFATRNRGKLRELRQLLTPHGVEVISLDDLGIVGEVEEDADTFAGNAEKKARLGLVASGLATLADDSGLEVDVLGGAPGVRSARFAGPAANDAANNHKLLSLLAGEPATGGDRRARFRCVLALCRFGRETVFSEGVCEGWIATFPRGDRGFGYDPVFLVGDGHRTMAELSHDEKNRISHRGMAFQKMLPHLTRDDGP